MRDNYNKNSDFRSSEKKTGKDSPRANPKSKELRGKSIKKTEEKDSKFTSKPRTAGKDSRFSSNKRTENKESRFGPKPKTEGRGSRSTLKSRTEDKDSRFASKRRTEEKDSRFGRKSKTEGRGFRSALKLRTEDKDPRPISKNPKARVYKTGPKPKRSTTALRGVTDEMRLNRFIANAGVCSRREADTYITAGMISVNGEIVTELGVKVKHDDEVRFDGRRLNPEKKVYLLLNKPKDFVTTTDDPHADKTVMDLIKDACSERIYPVGRLDRNTTGVLLFTNDGDLSKKLTHPKHNMKKVYQVSLDNNLTKEHMLQIADGVKLEDGFINADAISYISTEGKNEIGIEIHSGKNRIVRRIFEHLGYRVKKLDRVYFAGLTKKNLPRGKWRFLSEKEVQFLKMK